MNLSDYISPTESRLAILNGKLYKVDNCYGIYYFVDYFKNVAHYEYDIKIDMRAQEVTINNTYNNDNVKRQLYIDYIDNILWLNDTINKDNDSVIHKIHAYLLYTAYQKRVTSAESTEQLLAKERIYRYNVLQEYTVLLNRISDALYEVVNAGNHSIVIQCKMSDYNVTKDHSVKWNPNHKTSDGTTCTSLDGYIAYLLRDTLTEYSYDVNYESQNVESLSLYFEMILRKRFPHLILRKLNTHTFELSFMDPNTLLL